MPIRRSDATDDPTPGRFGRVSVDALLHRAEACLSARPSSALRASVEDRVLLRGVAFPGLARRTC